jgi:hypothetical protein
MRYAERSRAVTDQRLANADCSDLAIVPTSSRIALWHRGFRTRKVGTIRAPGFLTADAQPEVLERIQPGPFGVPTTWTVCDSLAWVDICVSRATERPSPLRRATRSNLDRGQRRLHVNDLGLFRPSRRVPLCDRRSGSQVGTIARSEQSAILLINGVNSGRQPFTRRGQLMSAAPGLHATI